jgi:hypothetical protein
MNTPASPRDGRLRDVAVLLTCLGALLLMPPFIGLVSPQRSVLGLPLQVLYLFSVWAGLIVGAAVLARRLDPAPPSDLQEPAGPAAAEPGPVASCHPDA